VSTDPDALVRVTAFVLLDHIRNDEELESYVQARVADAVEQAVARERERCAALVEGRAGPMRTGAYEALIAAADAIRTTKATT
jgi:hypothetical protein